MTASEILKKYFGYDTFREGQESLIGGILSGRDVLGIMPTGAGKSLCFQVPAMIFGGVTLVVSPLISLMKDQIHALTQSGIPAAFINSSLTERQIYKALDNAKNGAYKLIYIAPERLLSPDFLYFAESAEISMLAVDEAHCISQWGQDFRPSYTQIPEFVSRLKKRPVVSAFTATATPRVKEDISVQLALEKPQILVSGFDRPNLYFDVKHPKDKFAALAEFLSDKRERSGIVYCSTRATVESVCEKLNEAGHSASRYHAGLSDAERRKNQDDFLHDRVQIMAATNAFGMGIDKSNVSFVVHFNMPKDPEGYYQEAGRAGRDGEPADCLLLYSKGDVGTNLFLINEDQQGTERLREMERFCTTSDCLRAFILEYFGETRTREENCGNCVNCETVFEISDITTDAQQILSCVIRMKERFGTGLVIDVLRGKSNAKVQNFGLDKLSTFGINEKSAAQLDEIISHLIHEEYLIKTAEKYPIIKRGPRAKEALSPDAQIFMKANPLNKFAKKFEQKSQTKKSHSAATYRPVNAELLAALKALRLEIAKTQNLPAFVIFHDSTLTDMCIKMPTTQEEFLNVSGVGAIKAEKYALQFLEKINEFAATIDAEIPTSPPPEFDPAKIETTPENITVSVLADKINCALLQSGHDKITGRRINDWLVTKGYMSVIEKDTKTAKIPTEEGIALGITSESREIRGEQVQINLFNENAQAFIVANAERIFRI
ncbi:MAG: DNA helicase RecQ [Defluviitaleaceae bacterium]|nr:DNA helicase RecQ [Defluviitaleaceae bacterium]